jgi:hypothetical protein
MPRAALGALLAVALLGIAGSARADKVEDAIAQLSSSDDFRVRTQAALALGSSKDQRAVGPLCSGLEDENVTVRAAAAAALGKLKLGGVDCLEKRQESEESSTVKAVIGKSIAKIRAAEAEEPAIGSDTRYYVAVGEVSDKTGRDKGEVDKLVRKTMKSALSSHEGWLLAPRGETTAQARARLKANKHVAGFYLTPKVNAPKYSDGVLTIKADIAVFTYPGKALKGMIPVTLSQEVSEESTETEDDLIRTAAEKLIGKLSANVERFR